jgi:hypothetical protein
MWLITDKNYIERDIGTNNTTLEQAIAEMIFYEEIKSINDIIKIEKLIVQDEEELFS